MTPGFGDHSVWENDEDTKLGWEGLVKKANEHEGEGDGQVSSVWFVTCYMSFYIYIIHLSGGVLVHIIDNPCGVNLVGCN